MGFQDDFARALVERRGDDLCCSELDSGSHLDAECCRGIPDQVRDDKLGVRDDKLRGRDEEDRHCEERSDVATQSVERGSGLPCCARNDEMNGGDDRSQPLRLSRGGIRVGDLPEEERIPTPSPSRKREGNLAVAADPTPSPPLKERGLGMASARHDGWLPDIRAQFLEALANCGNVQSAAVFVQRSRTSAYNLKRRDMDFALAWDAALLLARDVATDMLQDRAINGVEEEVYYHGEVVATRRRYDSRLLLAHIARLDKLAEGVATSRAAARFGEVTEAIAAQDDIAPLIEEPTEAEKVERARLLTVMGHAAENNDTAAMSDEPVEAFMCTFNDDPPEIYMMTESDAEAMEEEVVGMTVRALDEGEAAAAMADFRERYLVNDDEGPVQGDGTEKGFDPVNVVNFEEQEKEEEEEKQR